MSKTYLLCLLAVFFGVCGLRVCYLVPRMDQLTQAKEYFNANPFVNINPNKRKTGDKSFPGERSIWYKIGGIKCIKLINVDDHGENVSSGRFDVLIIDEMAQLMNKKKEAFIYEKTDGLTNVSRYPKELLASTPLIGSMFVAIKEDWELLFPEYISWRNFENTPDNFVNDTVEKREKLEFKRAQADRMGILWDWECENLAVPRTPGGNPFPNVVWDETFKFRLPKSVGFDYHGPDIGHIDVQWWWSEAAPLRVYAVHECAHKYLPTDSAQHSVSFMGNEYYQDIPRKVSEVFGFNQGYARDARNYNTIFYDNTPLAKKSVVYNFLHYEAHISRLLTPNFANDVKNARWDKPSLFKVYKNASGITFRNHYLDAGLIGLPIIGQGGIIVVEEAAAESSFHNDGAGGLINRQKRAGVWKGKSR